MAHCNYCSRSGWLVSVDGNGLCDECRTVHLPVITSESNALIQSFKIIEESKNATTKLSRISIARRACHRLSQYHAKGVPTITRRPADVLNDLDSIEVNVIEMEIRDAIFTARQRSLDASTDAARLTPYAKAVERLTKLFDYTSNISLIETSIKHLRNERDKIRVVNSIRRADIWIAKGKLVKAAEVLRAAIVELKYDSVPDSEQEELILEIESKLRELSL